MLARALLSVKPLFADLTASERLVDSIAAHLRVIDQSGPLAALAQAAGRT
jgi:hypothetical protein